MRFLMLLFCLAAAGAHVARADSADDAVWQLLREGGKIVFIRHAYAPGGGDPDNLTIGDCSTQRNLDEDGIAQSVKLGELFAENAAPVDAVYSSQWCRCMDTAKHAFGDYTELPALNSTFSPKFAPNHPRQMEELQEFVANWQSGGGNLVFVTHYVIVGGMLGYYPGSGEIVVANQNLEVLGSIKTGY